MARCEFRDGDYRLGQILCQNCVLAVDTPSTPAPDLFGRANAVFSHAHIPGNETTIFNSLAHNIHHQPRPVKKKVKVIMMTT